MNLAIVIVNWNGRELLERCLQSIRTHAGDIDHQTIVVDNGSHDGSQALVRDQFPQVRLIASERNLGFGGANNLGIRALLVETGARTGTDTIAPPSALFSRHYRLDTEYILLLNPDTVVRPGALQALLAFMRARPHVGIAGARLLNEDGSFQSSFVAYPSLTQELLMLSGLGRRLHHAAYPSAGPEESRTARDDIDYVVGACMIARSSAVREVGLFDEGFFMYSEEVDWCYRFRKAGWRVGYTPHAEILHLGGGSTRLVRPQMLAELYRSRVRFFQKHYGPHAALLLRALLLLMNTAKATRAAMPLHPTGAPPLSWPLLRHALSGDTARHMANER